MAANPRLRYMYVAWAFLECLLFAGLYYGWGSLVFVLIEDGVYSELCDGYSPNPNPSLSPSPLPFTTEASDIVPASTTYDLADQSVQTRDQKNLTQWNQNCPRRDERLALVFTIACAMSSVGTLVMGHLNYKYGTRVTRISASLLYMCGALLTAFTSHDLPWLIFPGLSLLAIGGLPILVTNTQFSMMFTRGNSTVVSLLCGAFDSSAGVPQIIKLLHDKGIPLRTSMLVICGAHLLTMVNTFFFLPKGFITKAKPAPLDIEVGSSHTLLTDKDNSPAQDSAQEREPLLKKAASELPSIKSCILSPLYLLHAVWLSILQLRFYYFLGDLNAWLNSLFSTKEDVSFYTDMSQYIMLFGVLPSLMAGIFDDIGRKIFDDSHFQVRRDLMPAVISETVTVGLGVVLSVLVLIGTTSILLPTFILNVTFRAFMFGIGHSYVSIMFPSEYFGALYGLLMILCALVGLGQYVLFSWSLVVGDETVNIFFLVFMTLALIHPLYQWILCRRSESSALRGLSNNKK